MSSPTNGDCLDIVRCLALYLRDQRDALEIISAAARSIADRLPRCVVRIWLSRPTQDCPTCESPELCSAAFNCLQLEASAGEVVTVDDIMTNIALGQGLLGTVGKSEEEHICPDTRGVGTTKERQWSKETGLHSFCGYPLRSAGRLLGVLGIYLKAAPSRESQSNLTCVSLLLSQALGSAFLRVEQQRLAIELESKVDRKTAELKTRVSDLEETRLAMLNMMSEAFETQRQMRELTEKLEQRVADRTAELRLAKEDAERANQLKSQFLSRVSHEFRTPMHGMISFAKLGIRRIDQINREKTLYYFQQILESAGELLPLIDDLLDISRIESGKVDYDFALGDLKGLLFDIVGKFDPLFAERNLAIKVLVSDDFPKRVRFDRKHLRQALVNLLGNAGKFGRQGTEVSVVLAVADDRICIRIADRGPGIPEEELEAVFEAFSQSTATRGSFEGAGLGLAITQAIVFSHDGRVAVSNRQGGGTEFVIFLPWNSQENERALTSPKDVPDPSAIEK